MIDTVGAETLPREQSTFGRRALRTPAFVAGAIIVLGLTVLALAAPVITPYSPTQQNLLEILQGPSRHHWLGTDALGRDELTRVIYAARVDLRIAVICVGLSLCLGIVLGAAAGYFGGFVETAIMRFADILSATPLIVIVIVLVFVLGAGERSIYITIAAIAWVAYARIMRAEVILAKDREYVLAARAEGLSTARILGRHILPNAVTQALTFATSDIVNIIMVIVFLGFLGLGIEPPSAEWGVMISDGQPLLQTKWQLVVIPGIAVVITGLGFALLGDGLSDLLRPE
jgi:peptide/nickel transport system permease protein